MFKNIYKWQLIKYEFTFYLIKGEISMGFINLPIGTMGGKVWWDTLENNHGWRLQHNKVFGQYRILDSENIRQAWSQCHQLKKT